ncbi:MAG: hypothetical protein QF599_01795, partial [Planctomycetota bacterium]|nr:hypothetical protein [Planctomycetota bacterium]
RSCVLPCAFAGHAGKVCSAAAGAWWAAPWPASITCNAPPQPAGAIAAGSTWRFQFWYRDAASGTAEPFNFSDALEITFCQ